MLKVGLDILNNYKLVDCIKNITFLFLSFFVVLDVEGKKVWKVWKYSMFHQNGQLTLRYPPATDLNKLRLCRD